MHKVWAVVRREFLERVRTKWFIISTILGPVFFVGMGVLPSLLLARKGRASDIVVVHEHSPTLAERVEVALNRSGRFRVQRESVATLSEAVLDTLTQRVRREDIDGFLILSAATIESGRSEYRGRNVSSLSDISVLERSVRQAVIIERLNRRGVDPGVVQEAQSGIDLTTLRISRRGSTGESGQATFFLGYGLSLILYIVILAYGITVMRSVIQEKQDRIIEILISSLKPFQLMLGKVIGVGGVGMVQMAVWAAFGFATMKYRTQLVGLFGADASAARSVQLPALGAELMLLTLVYFLLGYFLYSALFAVVGAAVNNETEAGQAQQPVMMVLIVTLFIAIAALNDPASELAVIGSMIPFSAPILMPVRLAIGDVPTQQIGLSLASMVAGVAAIVWVAARIYRIGILMYGKRPSPRELLRWARQS
ncbi:MAG TPA: ABC transporter permease [Gemmatimonadales bacterium]|nr:ABC transporter permease [Gemmatimonadales bacterium]